MSFLSSVEFFNKWQDKFKPNNVNAITEVTFQEFATDIKDSFLSAAPGPNNYVLQSSVKSVLSNEAGMIPSMILLNALITELRDNIKKRDHIHLSGRSEICSCCSRQWQPGTP